MALIDLTNNRASLVASSEGRAGSPDGNVFFDKTNGLIEFIRADELADFVITDTNHPSYTDGVSDFTNPLIEVDGLKLEAVYDFENERRANDETLRGYDRWTKATFKFAGAFAFVNSRKPATDADRDILRGSGWKELASDGGIDRIYFGNKGLSNIESGSQPYYQLAIGGAPVDFAKVGQFDEAVQVYGDTGNTPSDAGAGDFDTRTYEAVSVRTFGYNYDRKETTTDLGITELGDYSTGFAVAESGHLTTGNYTIADVYDTPIAPWDNMTLEELDSPVERDEFSDQTGTYTFTWVLNNPGTGSNGSPTDEGNLDEMVAYLDAIAQTDDDINAHVTNTTNGKRVGTWYSYNAQGKVVLDSPFASEGLYMYNVPIADQQRVVMKDDGGTAKAYAFTVSLEITVGATAKADSNAWYHNFFAAAFNTAGYVEVEDPSTAVIKGLCSTANVNNKIISSFDYTGDTVGGSANTDKDCVCLVEGDGGATQAKTLYTITENTTVAFSCAPGVETNV